MNQDNVRTCMNRVPEAWFTVTPFLCPLYTLHETLHETIAHINFKLTPCTRIGPFCIASEFKGQHTRGVKINHFSVLLYTLCNPCLLFPSPPSLPPPQGEMGPVKLLKCVMPASSDDSDDSGTIVRPGTVALSNITGICS